MSGGWRDPVDKRLDTRRGGTDIEHNGTYYIVPDWCAELAEAFLKRRGLGIGLADEIALMLAEAAHLGSKQVSVPKGRRA